MTGLEAARKGNMGQLYDTMKKMAGHFIKPEQSVKNKEVKSITGNQEQWNRWVERFEELLKRPAPLNQPDIKAAHTDITTDVPPPTNQRIKKSTRS